MANKIQIRRGLAADIPTLSSGEPAFTTDELNFYVGTGSGNVNMGGSLWTSGTAMSGTSTSTTYTYSAADAKVGDYYLNTSTGGVYRCTTAGTGTTAKWTYQGSIKGATGATGSTGSTGATGAAGADGEDGERGSVWNSGTALTGTSTSTTYSYSAASDALVGDYYLNTSTGDVYRCTTAGSGTTAKWTYQGSIKGATGSTGATGATGADGRSSATYVVAAKDSVDTANADYVCDQSADQTEINQAITAANTAGGGTVVLLEGTYVISGSITMLDNVTLQGQGAGTILKRSFNNSYYYLSAGVVYCNGKSDCIIRDLAIDGNSANYTSTGNNGIILIGGTHNTVENVIVHDTYYGIVLSGGETHSLVHNAHIYDCVNAGIDMYNNGYCTISECFIHDITNYGIYIDYCPGNNKIVNNSIVNSYYCVCCTRSNPERHLILGNNFYAGDNSSSYSVYLSGKYDLIADNMSPDLKMTYAGTSRGENNMTSDGSGNDTKTVAETAQSTADDAAADIRTYATYVVAASDSVNKDKADYTCDGTADEEQIQAALDALPTAGGKIVFLEGTYNIASTISISAAKKITLEGIGSSTDLVFACGVGIGFEITNINAEVNVKDMRFSTTTATSLSEAPIEHGVFNITFGVRLNLNGCYFGSISCAGEKATAIVEGSANYNSDSSMNSKVFIGGTNYFHAYFLNDKYCSAMFRKCDVFADGCEIDVDADYPEIDCPIFYDCTGALHGSHIGGAYVVLGESPMTISGCRIKCYRPCQEISTEAEAFVNNNITIRYSSSINPSVILRAERIEGNRIKCTELQIKMLIYADIFSGNTLYDSSSYVPQFQSSYMVVNGNKWSYAPTWSSSTTASASGNLEYADM